MATKRNCGISIKQPKHVIHTSESIIVGEKIKPKSRPHLPTVKDTVQISIKTSLKPSIPTINETVYLDKQYNRLSNKIKNKKVDKTVANKLTEEQKFEQSTTTSTNKKNIHIFLEKKKKERVEKNKINLIEKKKIADERNNKLEQLQKTTKELVKASVKKKNICIQDESKIDTNSSTKPYQPKIDQTWFSSPKVNGLKKTLRNHINLQNKLIENLEITHDKNDRLNFTKNIENTTSTPTKLLNFENTTLGKIIEKTPKIVDTNTSFDEKYHNNVKLIEENSVSNQKQQMDSMSLNKQVSDVNLQIKPVDFINIDNETCTELSNTSRTNIFNKIDHSIELQELIFDQCLPYKKYSSESTQTDDHNNELSFFPSKATLTSPPMNFISVLKCKSSLQQTEKNDFELNKPVSNFSTNDYSVIDNLNTNTISSMDNNCGFSKTTVLPTDYYYNKIINFPNDSHIKHGNYLDKNVLLDDKPVELKYNRPYFNQIIENNVYNEKTNTEHNDDLSAKSSTMTNEDIKQILKTQNIDQGLLTRNIDTIDLSDTCTKFSDNCSINTSVSKFPEIHNEFLAELDTLDQLNDSLCDIENMSCDTSIKTNEQCIDDSTLKTIFNTSHSNINESKPFSKLNALSSNMFSVDKTITGFSIQMFEQLIKDEELRAKQHYTILRLKEKSLINRLNWENAMHDLHIKHLKNRPGQEKYLQLFKQKQRGSVKKLEHSLSQVKRLGRVIVSVYKKRLVMLEEHLQHLKLQSSSKKVIRKLKSLDQLPKKEEYACQSLNYNLLKQFNKTDSVDTVKNEHINKDFINFDDQTKNNSSSSIFELNKSKTILRNQATSPIQIEKNIFKTVAIIETEINKKHLLQSENNKYLQISKERCKNINNKIPIIPINVAHKNESEILNVANSERRLSPIFSTCPQERFSESSISTNSEQSDMDVRLISLQKQLEARKIESFKLRKQQKKLRLENLKAKEQDLLKQIELYDKKIEESKKSLIVEVEKKKIQLAKYSIISDSSSKHFSDSIIQNVNNYENNRTLKEHDHCQNLQASDRITKSDRKKNIYPYAVNRLGNHNILTQDKPVCEESKENANNHCSVKIDSCELISQSFQSLEKNQICGIVPLHIKSIVQKGNILKISHEMQTELNNCHLKSKPEEVLVFSSIDSKENLKEETHSSKTDEVIVKTPIYENSASEQDVFNINSNSQELYLEQITDSDKLTISNHSTTNKPLEPVSFNSCELKKELFIDTNDVDKDVSTKYEADVGQLEVLNTEVEKDQISNYSTDFTSDENISEMQISYKANKNDAIIIQLQDGEQNNESSYEEERSEGEVMYEDKTFIEQYSDDNNLDQVEKSIDDKVDVITNNILNSLLDEIKKTLKSNINNPIFPIVKKSDLSNLTEETPLLMILKREEEHQHKLLLSEQATIISDELLKRYSQPLISNSIQTYLLKLNETEIEKLTLYLNWSSKRKKLKLPEYLNFQHKTSDISGESFEMFYLKYQEQKNSSNNQDGSCGVMLSQTQQEADKLKLEQMRIEKEIECLRLSEGAQVYLREIPSKPPPPYKSPTKKKVLDDMPYTTDEIHEIILDAAGQLFNDPKSSMSNEFIMTSESNLHVEYKTLIFDFCKEIILDAFLDDKNVPVWKRPIKKLKHFRAKPKSPEDLKDIVVKRINQIIDIDDCEEKVNKFVVTQLHVENSKWTDFQMDEIDIKNDIVQNIMKKLICDTITNTKTNFYLKFCL